MESLNSTKCVLIVVLNRQNAIVSDAWLQLLKLNLILIRLGFGVGTSAGSKHSILGRRDV